MEWGQICTLIGTNLVLFMGMMKLMDSWRKEGKEDYIRLEKKLDAWRDESNTILKEIGNEIKDFHGRLCAIEERKKETKG